MTDRKDLQQYIDIQEEWDGRQVNASNNKNLNTVIATSRRSFLKGGLGLAISGAFASTTLVTCINEDSNTFAKHHQNNTPASPTQSGHLGFQAIPVEQDESFDSVTVPPGYTAKAFYPWGTPINASTTPWLSNGNNSAAEQAMQAGQCHDGMHFFAFDEATQNQRGLLVMNHEFVIQATLHPNGATTNANGNRPAEEVNKEKAAHGVSIIEIQKNALDDWEIVLDSPYNRRITADTEMQLTGIAAANAFMKTAADETGKHVFGTLNNCAHGITPWGTYLACEENWQGYFVNKDKADYNARASHKRYGVATQSSRYAWETVDARFNATPDDNQAHHGYVNEPHKFGWVVEIDPFDPTSTPKKRTSMGRLIRECATLSLGPDNRMAFYFGDDSRGEYVYKFVPSQAYNANHAAANKDILDDGILYVARFNDDGTGQWLALLAGQNGLTANNGFKTQADVMLNARSAADILGATPMDRPEWVAVHPVTREGYITLTNNRNRGIHSNQPINTANPRPENQHGQILRWREADNDPSATTFSWDVFLLAGDAENTRYPDGRAIPNNYIGDIKGDIFSSPDGLWFDHHGRLWIQTDYNDNSSRNANMGTNQMLAADPVSKQVKRFLAGPRGCEITGITSTPNGTTLFINIQHPSISWPAEDGITRPRSATVIITKDDGDVIGS